MNRCFYSWMEFCMNIYLDNLTNPIDFQGHRSKGQDRIFGFFTIARQGKKFVDRGGKLQPFLARLVTTDDAAVRVWVGSK